MDHRTWDSTSRLAQPPARHRLQGKPTRPAVLTIAAAQPPPNPRQPMTGRFAPSAKGRSIPGRTGVMIDWTDYLADSAHDVEVVGRGPASQTGNYRSARRASAGTRSRAVVLPLGFRAGRSRQLPWRAADLGASRRSSDPPSSKWPSWSCPSPASSAEPGSPAGWLPASTVYRVLCPSAPLGSCLACIAGHSHSHSTGHN
jgi:hypothetical protein